MLLVLVMTAAPTAACEPTVTADSGTGTETLTAAQVNAILTAHNNARKGVSPSASVMPLLTWNEDLAVYAALSLANCPGLNQTPTQRTNLSGFLYVGENLAAGLTYSPANGGGVMSVVEWDKEKVDYNLSAHVCVPTKECGRSKQVVWADSLQVGCSFKPQLLPSEPSNVPS